MRLIYLGELKHPQWDDWWLWRLADIDKDRRDDLTGSKTLSKAETTY